MNESANHPAPGQLPPRYRMWLWVWATVLGTLPLMGLCFQLARVTELPLILVFAPAVLLAHYSGRPELSTAYVLMPLQCLAYGLPMARSELTGRRRRTGAILLAVHLLCAIAALAATGGTLAAK